MEIEKSRLATTYLYSELPEAKVFNINESEFKNTQNLFEEFTKTITLVGFDFSYRINKRQKSKTKSSLLEPRHEKAIKKKMTPLKNFKKLIIKRNLYDLNI